MLKETTSPAQDNALRSVTGETQDGQPLSVNRAPAEDLRPWVARVLATNVTVEPDYTLSCGLIYDTPVLRMLFDGDWTAETSKGTERYRRSALFFGPHSKSMPVTVKGNFSTLSVQLNPGAMGAFGPFPTEPTVDRIIPYNAFGFDEHALYERFDGLETPEEWLLEVEEIMREYLRHKRGKEPDPLSTAFDIAAFEDPNMKVSDFADEHGVSPKKIERVVKRDFGLSPKKVLRRARALDMAAALRGVGDRREAEEMALRFFDQSHLNREFMDFFGVSPVQFVKTPQPLLTLALEVRQARRLELLGRIDEGEKRPWMD